MTKGGIIILLQEPLTTIYSLFIVVSILPATFVGLFLLGIRLFGIFLIIVSLTFHGGCSCTTAISVLQYHKNAPQGER